MSWQSRTQILRTDINKMDKMFMAMVGGGIWSRTDDQPRQESVLLAAYFSLVTWQLNQLLAQGTKGDRTFYPSCNTSSSIATIQFCFYLKMK